MVKGKRGQFYDDDDFDDGYDDDDYYEEEEEEPLPVKQPVKAAAGAKPGASGLAGGAKPAAKPDPAIKNVAQAKYPISPAAGNGSGSSTPGAPPGFKFDTPSPDDAVRAAQAGKSGAHPGVTSSAPAPSAAPSLAPSKNLLKPSPAMQAQAQQRQNSVPSSASSATESMLSSLNLGGGGAAASTSTSDATTPSGQQAAQNAGARQPLSQRRPVSEYTLEPDLARECDAAHAAETSGAGGRDGGPALPALHLVVLGHVDAGKSTLMGRLLHDLGYVSQKEAHKNQRDAAQAGKGSFAWAWVLDERPEERQRGITVDVAMTRFNTQRFAVTLLDAPGHRDFVPNMIAGAAQADAALLLVDGSPGGFEAGFEAVVPGGVGGGQTREHAQLARSLGVEQLAVVISKLDTVGYAQERFEAIKAQLEPFLRTCGFKDSSVQWLPAVGPAGENLTQAPQEPALAAWWSGPTLVAAIDAFAARERVTARPLRMPITDVFRSKTGSVVVGGKVEGGALKPGSRVLVVPLGEAGTVRSIECGGLPASLGRAGDSVEVVLQGIDTTNICSGSVLCHPEYPIPLVKRFELRVLVLDVPTPILSGHPVTLHAHSAREAGHVSGLVALLNAKTGEVSRAKPRCLLRGQTALVEVSATRSLCLEEYSDYRALGRVALREGGRTLMVGVVTKLLE